MIIFPAVDILQGRCVRLVGGELGTERLISNDPLSVARDWELRGAQGLHLVDLDAAFERGHSRGLIEEILQHVQIPVQVGGGVRTAEDIRVLIQLGATRIIIGTQGILKPDWLKQQCRDFPDRLILALDAVGHEVVIRGWREKTAYSLVDFARTVDDIGLSGILYTNVSVEGRAGGLAWEPVEKLVRSITLPVIYSGGVISLDEIRHLRQIGIAGVILGTALYFGGIDFEQAQAAAQGQEVPDAGAAAPPPEGPRATKRYEPGLEPEVRVDADQYSSAPPVAIAAPRPAQEPAPAAPAPSTGVPTPAPFSAPGPSKKVAPRPPKRTGGGRKAAKATSAHPRGKPAPKAAPRRATRPTRRAKSSKPAGRPPRRRKK